MAERWIIPRKHFCTTCPVQQAGVSRLPHVTCKSVHCHARKEEDRESRLEEFEQKAKRRTVGTGEKESTRSPAQKQVVIWPEGELLPLGWDEMDPAQKAYQLYMGERGFLFWLNKAAFASVFVLGGAWILFRFVGPALGLYTLVNGPPVT